MRRFPVWQKQEVSEHIASLVAGILDLDLYADDDDDVMTERAGDVPLRHADDEHSADTSQQPQIPQPPAV